MLKQVLVAPPKPDKHPSHEWHNKDGEETGARNHEDGKVVDKSVDHLH